MADLLERKPWSYISHKDGEWIGIMAADCGVSKMAKSWIRDVKDFIATAIMDGEEIFTAYSREEHEDFLKTKEMYRRGAR
jgi:hypothetical protein